MLFLEKTQHIQQSKWGQRYLPKQNKKQENRTSTEGQNVQVEFDALAEYKQINKCKELRRGIDAWHKKHCSYSKIQKN